MEHYAGIDVSLELSSVCVVDAQGKIVKEEKVASDVEALVVFFVALGFAVKRIGLEAGPLSQWLHAGLKRAGFEVCWKRDIAPNTPGRQNAWAGLAAHFAAAKHPFLGSCCSRPPDARLVCAATLNAIRFLPEGAFATFARRHSPAGFFLSKLARCG
jgi:hypothetical protein